MIRFSKLKAVSCAALAVTLVAACGEAVDHATETVTLRPVRTLTVGSETGLRQREFPGVVDAVQRAELSFRVAGKLEAIEVAQGDDVAADQVIARLDPTDFETRLASVRADYERARADFERAEELVEEGYVSRTDYDKLRAQFTNTQSQLEAAQRDLESTVLRAPFAGVAAQRHVDVFEEVNAKQPILTLLDLTTLKVKIDVPESVMIRVRPKARHTDRTIVAEFPGIPGEAYPLTLLEVSGEPDPASGTYEATFTMPAIENRVVLPGMTVTVKIEAPEFDQSTGRPVLPANVVMEDRDGRFVWIADPSGEGTAVIRRRNVETGELTGEGLSVTAGLAAGDRVVTAGMSRIVEGQEVRIGTDGER